MTTDGGAPPAAGKATPKARAAKRAAHVTAEAQAREADGSAAVVEGPKARPAKRRATAEESQARPAKRSATVAGEPEARPAKRSATVAGEPQARPAKRSATVAGEQARANGSAAVVEGPKARPAKRRAAVVADPKSRTTTRPAPAFEEPTDSEPIARATRVDDREAPAPPAPTRPPFRGRDAGVEIELLRRSAAERRAAARPPASHPAAPPAVRVGGGRRTTTGQRVVALLALALLPLAVVALATSGGPAVAMSRADASFLSAQLVQADQRVRAQLVRLRAGAASRALVQTREAVLTTRSLGVEMRSFRGAEAARLRRTLRLEGRWLDAVGSTLYNPRSPLRAQLAARDATARRALAALPGARPSIRSGRAQLVAYSRLRAGRARGPAQAPARP
jgi:hypothetical protein